MVYTTGEQILANHPAYETDDRMGNRWFQGRYRPGIREFGYPVRLPQEQWGPIAKIRDGFDERSPSRPYRWTRNNPDEQTTQRSSRDDR